MKNHLTVVDIGTTSTRVALYDENGERLATKQRSNPPDYGAVGQVEQEPSSWTTALYALLSEVARVARSEHGATIDALALTALRSPVIPVDTEGKALTKAIMWQDKRADEICRRYADRLDEVYRRTGIRISSVFSAPKIRWIKENMPDVASRAAKYLGVQDYLLHELTGNLSTDHSFAGRTNLLNLETLQWDPELLELFGIERERLCDLVAPGAVVGELLPQSAERAGLRPGIPVVTAGGDQQCAALGMGLFGADRIVTNTGTGSYALGYCETPIWDREMRLLSNPAAVAGSFTVEATIPTTGTIYRWLSRLFYGEEGEEFSRINEEATASPPGSNGVRVTPHFQGSGSPYWDPSARGSFSGLTLATTRGDMARAVLEGIARELGRNIELIREKVGSVESVRTGGGLSKLPLFNQIQADVYGLPVELLQETESTALGAWISAAVGLGWEKSYAEAYNRASRGIARRFEPNPGGYPS